MYFYRDINGLYRLNGFILPTGAYLMKLYNSKTVMSVISTEEEKVITEPIDIVEIQKENGTTYIDIDELLGAIGGFFK